MLQTQNLEEDALSARPRDALTKKTHFVQQKFGVKFEMSLMCSFLSFNKRVYGGENMGFWWCSRKSKAPPECVDYYKQTGSSFCYPELHTHTNHLCSPYMASVGVEKSTFYKNTYILLFLSLHSLALIKVFAKIQGVDT